MVRCKINNASDTSLDAEKRCAHSQSVTRTAGDAACSTEQQPHAIAAPASETNGGTTQARLASFQRQLSLYQFRRAKAAPGARNDRGELINKSRDKVQYAKK